MLFISDANIFIDLDSIGLLDVVSKLSDEIVTTDIVFQELYDSQKNILESIGIRKLDFDANSLMELYAEYQALGSVGISIEDFSLVFKAKKENGAIISGDKQLRNFSMRENIDIYGIFYIMDKILSEGHLDKETWVTKLYGLQEANERLPKKEFEKRLNK